MIYKAIIMCGGKSTRFGGVDKSLYIYKGRSIISYLLSSLKDLNIKEIILVCNKKNRELIKREALNYFGPNIVLINSPESFRKGIKISEEHLNGPFLLLAGNQPISSNHLKKIIKMHDKTGDWVVSLYPPEISTENSKVSLSENNIISQKEELVLQHPMIISDEIIKFQEEEKYANKLEETLKRLSRVKSIRGVISKAPPEFDNKEMLKNNKKYIRSNKIWR
ncbi:MAG: NTP transferase domain-containing protein [Candidatus Pacearchaeota archaeon]|nr:NTP transferase domain-containing protein [Candidatus Pacearchaeota archaeon]MDE1848682.1 nucleotidyltransferase family protein [Nanoarchaeota archaeon]